MPKSSFLVKDHLAPAGTFINSPLWADFKRVLSERRPPAAETTDSPDTAAAKGHQRTGFEGCIEEIEALPFEVPEEVVNPMDRPAVNNVTD